MPVYDPVLTEPVSAPSPADPGTATTAPDATSTPPAAASDPGGAPVLEPAYKTRFLAADGTQITAEAYAATVASNVAMAAADPAAATVPVYRAAFVGCTYHCG
jgi:hypothetical protein